MKMIFLCDPGGTHPPSPFAHKTGETLFLQTDRLRNEASDSETTHNIPLTKHWHKSQNVLSALNLHEADEASGGDE